LFFIWINKWVNLFTQHNTFNLILISANSHWHLRLHLAEYLVASQRACMSFSVFKQSSLLSSSAAYSNIRATICKSFKNSTCTTRVVVGTSSENFQ
jgi:hypothetical protein